MTATSTDYPTQIIPMPRCPACGSHKSAVRTSRALGGGFRQARVDCKTCGTRYPVLFSSRVVSHNTSPLPQPQTPGE